MYTKIVTAAAFLLLHSPLMFPACISHIEGNLSGELSDLSSLEIIVFYNCNAFEWALGNL